MPEKRPPVKEKLPLQPMLTHRGAQEGITLRLPALAFGSPRRKLFHVKQFYFETGAYWYPPGRVYCATGAGDSAGGAPLS